MGGNVLIVLTKTTGLVQGKIKKDFVHGRNIQNGHFKVFLSITLFALQVFLILQGVCYFGKYFNPILLLVCNLWLSKLFFSSLFISPESLVKIPGRKKELVILLFFSALMSFVILIFFNELIRRMNQPIRISDIIPQLETQYSRFKSGVSPYSTIDLPCSKPFPVYMPFHWLPLAISDFLNIDSRWSGMIILLLCLFYYGCYISFLLLPFLLRLSLIILPYLVVFSFVFWGKADMAVSLETTIAAFYLLLGIGLLKAKKRLVLTGVILCLLSRYTLIFWLPVFAIAYLKEYGVYFSVKAVAMIFFAVVLFYVFPFMMNDSSIFLTGLKYHNGAAVFEWANGAWTFDSGIYFAPHMNSLFNGNYFDKVKWARIVQASVMMAILFWGLLYYRRFNQLINANHFLLGMLFLILTAFYMFGPLTYRYYLLTNTVLSALMIAVIAGRQSEQYAKLQTDS